MGSLENKRWIHVPSFLNVIYTTKSVATADPEWTNWRCCIIRCSDAPCSPEFEAYLGSARVQRAFYQSLLGHDISSYRVSGWSDFVSEFSASRGVYDRRAPE
jgi:hypothetical protein